MGQRKRELIWVEALKKQATRAEGIAARSAGKCRHNRKPVWGASHLGTGTSILRNADFWGYDDYCGILMKEEVGQKTVWKNGCPVMNVGKRENDKEF